MPRTDEAEAFFYAVYSAIQEIPHGKVTSYGHIARLIGTRECPLFHQPVPGSEMVVGDIDSRQLNVHAR
jgi:hypothetical protein